MEIHNSSHFSHDAYLLSRRENNADSKNISPLKQIEEDKEHSKNKTAQVESIQETEESAPNRESEEHSQPISLFQPINLTKAQQQNRNNPQNDEQNYKVHPQQQHVTHHAEKAISSYNNIENSQYGQELVNRIEAMV